MADVQHSNLTGSDLHEPKGASSASNNTVYVSDGAGSGAWSKIDTDSMDTSSVKNVNKFKVMVVFEDVSTAGDIFIPVSEDCDLNDVTAIIDGALATSDVTLTINNNGGSNMGTLVVPYSSSSAGDVVSQNSLSNNSLSADQYVKISSDGASTNTVSATIMLDFSYT